MSITSEAPPSPTSAARSDATGRAARLKQATHDLHEALDRRIMDAGLFADRAGYTRFLAMQRRLHADIDAIYRDARVGALIPDLAERRRLHLIDLDLADLALSVPAAEPVALDGADRGTALGWLYVVEGSNLGAAFLAKFAAKLGFDDGFGARSLAGHPEGRGLHWRRFLEALNAAALTAEEEERAESGAVAAFLRARALAEDAAASS